MIKLNFLKVLVTILWLEVQAMPLKYWKYVLKVCLLLSRTKVCVASRVKSVLWALFPIVASVSVWRRMNIFFQGWESSVFCQIFTLKKKCLLTLTSPANTQKRKSLKLKGGEGTISRRVKAFKFYYYFYYYFASLAISLCFIELCCFSVL